MNGIKGSNKKVEFDIGVLSMSVPSIKMLE